MVSHSVDDLHQTPLYSFYKEHDIKLVDFGGWALPVQYSGILKEHQAVRERAGLFEVSHMGQLLVQGENAETWLNGLVTNDLSKMKLHQAQYNAVCKEDGGTLDDLIILKMDATRYFVTPNASNTDKIYAWFQAHLEEGISVQNVSEEYGLLALQGPLSETILQRLTSTSLNELKPFYCFPEVILDGDINVLLSRTGYTGEDGFEIYCKAAETEKLWKLLLEAGKEDGLLPCGLGARDTLRLEMGYPLYGQELGESISPLEGGIGFAVKLKTKEADFIGKDVLASQRKEGPESVVCGFQMSGRGIPRTGYAVLNQDGEEIGKVTSGSKSPSLGTVIGMALLKRDYKEIGTKVIIQIRNKEVEAEIVKKPFYTPN